jgi:hypothetical protein
VILHIGNPEPFTPPTNALCPIWQKTNELFGKVFSHRSPGTVSSPTLSASEAGLLYLGIQKGWDKTSNAWRQSPALRILKQVDDLLFCQLPNIERLAYTYKSYKLLKVCVR